MGIARSLIAMAALGLVTSCTFEASSRQTAAPPKPTEPPPRADRPATYGVPRPLGGSTLQWSLMITVDALDPDDDNWYNDQYCDTSVDASTDRQRLFAERMDVALAGILLQNSHCAVTALAPLVYGQNGCSDYYNASQPSGVYAVFSCTNSEPLNTTKSPPPTPLP